MKDIEGKKGLGVLGLTAIVFSAMVGGGIFNIAQNMASHAGLAAVVAAWLITGIGMLFLVLTFQKLSQRYPEKNQGLYEYARSGFGNYAGFNIAWGYWLCVTLGNVAFVVMLNDAMGAFFPVLLEHGWESIVLCETMVWVMFCIVERGIMTASFLNTVMSCLKFGAIFLIIVLLFVYFRMETMFTDVWGTTLQVDGGGSFRDQIMGTMFITMFCFVGIEGAVMLSSYAKRNKDVGRASVIGFYLALAIYALISVMCYGIRSRAELAQLHDPSVAYVLRLCCGDWAYYFVIVTVIVSILSGFISWTLLCSQAPFGAAKVGLLPSYLLKTNRHEVPIYGLTLSTVFMSLFILVVCAAPDVYIAALNLTTIMVLPAYAMSGAFLLRASRHGFAGTAGLSAKDLCWGRVIGFLCIAYCVWCIIGGGFLLFLASSILYLAGFYLYYVNYRQKSQLTGERRRFLTAKEWILFALIAIASAVSIVLLSIGKISLS